MTGITAHGIEVDREIAASPEAVFTTWTTPQHFSKWFGGPAVNVPPETIDFVAEAGKSWTAQMVLPDGNSIDWAGEFIEVQPDTRLVLTMTDRPADPNRAELVVELAATPGGTRMRFTQETPGFSPEQQAQVLAGWQTFIDELERIATRHPPRSV